MKILTFLLFLTLLGAGANGFSQSISLSVKNVPLEKVFKEIERQSSFRFIYTREQLEPTLPVSVEKKNVTIAAILQLIFADQPLAYSIEDKYVLIKNAAPKATAVKASEPIKGKVVNERGEPMEGVTVRIKGTDQITTTDKNGEFSLTGTRAKLVLLISGAEIEAQEIYANGQGFVQVTAVQKINMLDETIIMGYGKTTRRFNTGSIGKVGAAEIGRQPVSNPLAAIQGRVSGVYITQASGLPGSNFNVQVRGKNSLKQGNQPLYIVDGVTFMLNSGTLTQATGSDINNPLNSINPSDIESIEILKDADATAIYGSQGANGVILITTKKGKTGKLKVDLNIYTGAGSVTRTLDLLHTPAYIQLRKEAYANDGIVPTAADAPDLLLWDTTAYTDWKKLLIGNHSHVTNAQLSFSGGSNSLQYIASANYNREVTVFPSDKPAERGTGRIQITQGGPGNKFKMSWISAYSLDRRQLPLNDLTQFIFLPPNAPAALDSAGQLNWNNWVSGTDNPLAQQFTRYSSETNNWLGNALLSYQFTKHLFIKLSAGYNFISLDEKTAVPIKSQRASSSATGLATMASNKVKSTILEPQLDYGRSFNKVTFDVLTGLSYQQRQQTGSFITAMGYTNDDLLGTLSAAGQVLASNSFSQYKYMAGFARLNVNADKRYILNLNVRRDGSSRFGPANQFSNFGSAGAAWLFSECAFIKKRLPFISYGKLRASYGVTGNDQIGDYQYLDSWTSSSTYNYQTPGILPSRLFNPYFGWERTRKAEAALEAGLFQDRLLLTVAHFRNRSDNQLVNYKLPYTTGFTSIVQNLPALIQNSGTEVEVSSRNIRKKNFEWSSSFNISILRNKLLDYPGLSISSDKNNYVTGEPLTISKRYHATGTDPQTGNYTFTDANSDGVINASDLTVVSFNGQRYFGGLSNDVRYKQFSLSVFFQFVKQQGRNYISGLPAAPGMLSNQPIYVSNRWRKAGDASAIQRYTSTANATAVAYYNYQLSDAAITDASFSRLKNLSFSYTAPEKILKRLQVTGLRIYVQGQNLVTFTRYKGADPETQSLTSLPLLKVLTAGIQLTL